MTTMQMMRRSAIRRTGRGLLLIAGGCLLACGQNYSDGSTDDALAQRDLKPMQEQANPHAAASPHTGAMGSPAAANPQEGVLGSMAMDVPEGWESVPPSSSMRVAEYRVAAAHGGGEDVSLAVFQGPMGSVEDNVRRWFGQFDSGNGKRRETTSTGGFTVTFVDVSGTYDGGMGMSGGGPKSDYRMLGAIVEGGGDSYYFKLTGPRVEVTPLEEAFEGMILSLRGA